MRPDPAFQHGESDQPYKRLAVAVLALAVKDARSSRNYNDAVQFFCGGPEESTLEFWCELAEIHPDRVRKTVAPILEARRPRY